MNAIASVLTSRYIGMHVNQFSKIFDSEYHTRIVVHPDITRGVANLQFEGSPTWEIELCQVHIFSGKLSFFVYCMTCIFRVARLGKSNFIKCIFF